MTCRYNSFNFTFFGAPSEELSAFKICSRKVSLMVASSGGGTPMEGLFITHPDRASRIEGGDGTSSGSRSREVVAVESSNGPGCLGSALVRFLFTYRSAVEFEEERFVSLSFANL
jgi:hypothetical protein